MKKTIEELRKFIAKEASFDGTADEECPHCHKVIHYGYSWIDHREVLASEITKFLGLGGMVQEIIDENLADVQFSHAEKKDFTELAERILIAVYG